jgi:hypothetical protein
MKKAKQSKDLVLSEEERELVLKRRAEIADGLVEKTAILKDDVIYIDRFYQQLNDELDGFAHEMLSATQILKIIKNLKFDAKRGQLVKFYPEELWWGNIKNRRFILSGDEKNIKSLIGNVKIVK